MTTNDDAVADCVTYANELRMNDEMERVPGTRPVIDDVDGIFARASCSISMCGNEDDPTCRMLRSCSNGHCMHDRCLEDMFIAARNVAILVCPQCRSDGIADLIYRARPIPSDVLLNLICGDRAVVMRAIKFECMEGSDAARALWMTSLARQDPNE